MVNSPFFIPFLSYVSLTPKTNFTSPLNGFGTFLTTIVKPLFLLSIYPNNIEIPPIVRPIPIIQSQAFKGRNKTSTIPSPNPIKHPGINFFRL